MACQFYCPGHYGSTMTVVNNFLETHSFVDVKLVCKNKKTVYSHKLILASASPFLKAVIQEMSSFDDMVTVYLPDFDYNVVTLLLTFLYEGVMKLQLQELEEFRELCNELHMTFPGAEVMKVPKDDDDSHLFTTQHPDDVVSAQPLVETELDNSHENSSFVAFADNVCASAKVPDIADSHSSVGSIIPKMEDHEEHEYSQLTVLARGPEHQNRSMIPNVMNKQHSVSKRDCPQVEIHRQISYETHENSLYSETTTNVESQNTVTQLQCDTPGRSLCHGMSSSTTRISQNTKMLHMNSIPLIQVSARGANFHYGSSSPAHQASASQSRTKKSDPTKKNFSTAVGVRQEQLMQISDSSDVHKKLLENTRVKTHKVKQSPHSNSSSTQSNTKEQSEEKSIQKSGPVQKRKKR